MNDQMVFGQYIHKNSLVHKLDARTKNYCVNINDGIGFLNTKR